MQVRNLAKSMVFGVAALASASVLAFDFDGVYVLGGVGVAGIEDGQWNAASEEGNSIGLEARTDFSWRGGAGLWLADHVGLEFNYFGLKSNSDTIQIGNDTLDLNVSTSSYFDISGLGRCFLADQLWVFGRAGVAVAHTKREVTQTLSNGFSETAELNEPTGMGASLGVGFQYDVTPLIGLRFEGSTVQALNDNDMYTVTGNLVLNFGEFM